jgi:hypothetical protein
MAGLYCSDKEQRNSSWIQAFFALRSLDARVPFRGASLVRAFGSAHRFRLESVSFSHESDYHKKDQGSHECRYQVLEADADASQSEIYPKYLEEEPANKSTYQTDTEVRGPAESPLRSSDDHAGERTGECSNDQPNNDLCP